MKKYSCTFVHVLACVLLASCVVLPGWAQQPSSTPETSSSAPQKVRTLAGITEYRLHNGLRVLLLPDQSDPKIVVNVVYLVGSRMEGYGETGMAHLLEHMMFKGTPTNPNIPNEMSEHGAQANANTADDRTSYFEIFTPSATNLQWALGLEADRMVHSNIAKKDLDSEMTVVRNEYERDKNSPMGLLYQRVLESAYLWHNYGHPTIGSRSDIENVPIQNLQAFYREYYQPDNAVLIVAGKIDPAKTLQLINQKFGVIQRPTRVLPKLYTVEPPQDGQRTVTLRRVGDTQGVMVAYHIPPASTRDEIAMEVLANVLSDDAAGRLRKQLVDTKLATNASGQVMALHDPGMIIFGATVPKDGNVKAARNALIKTVEGVANDPISETEFTRIHQQMINGYDRMMTNTTSVAMSLPEAIADGDWRLLFWRQEELKKITLQDLQSVAAKYLIPSNRTVGMFIPDAKPVRADIPGVPDIMVMLQNFQYKSSVSAGQQLNPTPANLEKHTTRVTDGDIKMAFLPKQTRGNLVTVVMNFRFGNEHALQGKSAVGRMTASLLSRGTLKHNLVQLQDAMTKLKLQIDVGGGPSSVSVNLRTDREHLPAALRLAAEILQQPSFPQTEFDQLKQRMLTSIDGAKTDPNAIAGNALQRDLAPFPPDNIRYVPTIAENEKEIKSVTLDQVKSFYHQFYGIGEADVAFVGNFDPKAAESEIKELFGNWKTPSPYQRILGIYKPVTQTTQRFETPDKTNSIFFAGTNLEIQTTTPDYPALVLANYIFGGGLLNSRLATRIRQKDGLSYSVGSQLQVSSLEKNGQFVVSAICAPQNEPKVEQDFADELHRALAGGFTAKEVADAKEGYLQSRKVELSSDGSIAGSLVSQLFFGRTFTWDERYDNAVKNLTLEQVDAAMRRYINPNDIVKVAAGDFAKNKSSK